MTAPRGEQHNSAAAARQLSCMKGSNLSLSNETSRDGAHMSDSVTLTKTKAPGLNPALSTYLAPATLDSPVVMLYVRSPQPACSQQMRHAAHERLSRSMLRRSLELIHTQPSYSVSGTGRSKGLTCTCTFALICIWQACGAESSYWRSPPALVHLRAHLQTTNLQMAGGLLGHTCCCIKAVHGELRQRVGALRHIHGAIEPVLEGHAPRADAFIGGHICQPANVCID